MFWKPNEYHKNVSTINWEKLKQQGFNVVVFDIDNTLDLPDKETTITKELLDYIDKVNSFGFEIIFFSNNTQERVDSFGKHFKHQCIANAKKPFRKNYKKFFVDREVDKIVFVGDKIVTDVIGGNLHGGYTILVDPLTLQKKYWYTKVMTFVENFFRKVSCFEKGNYYE